MASCGCLGPRPGHKLCPCRERAQSAQERRIAALEEEIRRLRDDQSGGRLRARYAMNGF